MHSPEATGAPLATDPALQQARLEILDSMFGKRFQGVEFSPVLWRTMTFHSAQSRAFFKRDFAFLSRGLQLELSYRSWRAFPEASLDKFSAVTTTKLTQIRALMSGTIARLKALFQSNGLSLNDIQFPRPITEQVPVIAPQARQYLELLGLLDELLLLTGGAALHGLIDTKQKQAAEVGCLRGLRAFKVIVMQEKRRLFQDAQAVAERATTASEPIPAGAQAAIDSNRAALAEPLPPDEDTMGIREGDVDGATEALDQAAAAAAALNTPRGRGGRGGAKQTAADFLPASGDTASMT